MLLQHKLLGCCSRLLNFVIPTANEISAWETMLLLQKLLGCCSKLLIILSQQMLLLLELTKDVDNDSAASISTSKIVVDSGLPYGKFLLLTRLPPWKNFQLVVRFPS